MDILKQMDDIITTKDIVDILNLELTFQMQQNLLKTKTKWKTFTNR